MNATKQALQELYPEIEPYYYDMLKVSDLHTIYFEESGNPKGKPILFLHGGPGLDPEPAQRRLFDPSYYRIITFDQRGTRNSTPVGELCENTTWHLIDDMESLRKHLGIKSWIIMGWSWGSFLALMYAEEFPEKVDGLIVSGTFLGRQWEIDFESDPNPSPIEKHYFENRCFLKNDNHVLDNIDLICDIPIVIIHGTEDMTTPLAVSKQLRDTLSDQASLRIVKDAGHRYDEPGIASELVCATDSFQSL